MFGERVLRRVSIGSRLAVAASVLLLPLCVLIPASVWIVQRQEAELERSIDEQIDVLLPLSTLEYDLQRALRDELMARSGEDVPDFGGLTQSIDRVFSQVAHEVGRYEGLDAGVEAARRDWQDARPAVERLVERVRPLGARTGGSSDVVRDELDDALRNVEQARLRLARTVRERATRTQLAQRHQLHLLLWTWAGTMCIALVAVGLLAYSIVRPVRALGRATQRLRDGESGVRVDAGGADELSEVAARFNEMVARLEMSRRELEHEARQDALTELPNRRAILDALDAALEIARADAAPVGVVMIDVDDFKVINDRHGHAAGDAALRWLAQEMRAGLRQEELLGRIAGDEFLLVLPGSDAEQARRIAERLSSAVAAHAAADSRCPGISAGVASAPVDGRTAAELLAVADTALYRAKADGRGRVAAVTAPA